MNWMRIRKDIRNMLDELLTRYGIEEKLQYVITQCLMAVAFFLPISLNGTTVFLLLGSVCWIAEVLLFRRKKFVYTGLDWWVVGFVLISGLSVYHSPDIGFSKYNYYHLMSRYVLIYYFVAGNIRSREQLWQIFSVLMVSSFVVCLYGLWQYVHGMDAASMEWVDKEQFPDLKIRIYATLQNPNLFAAFLIMMITMAGGVALKLSSQKEKFGILAMVLLMSGCLILTYSRGAWISLLLVIAVFGVTYNRKLLWLLLLLPVGALLASHDIWGRIASIANPTDTSSTMRLALWESTVAMIRNHPIGGIGWGAYWLVYPEYDFYIQDVNTKIFHAHNTYLQLAAEMGIPGLIAFLGFAGGHGWAAIKACGKKDGSWINGLAAGIVGALGGMAVNGMTDHVLFNIQISMFFWFCCGLILVLACNRSLDTVHDG